MKAKSAGSFTLLIIGALFLSACATTKGGPLVKNELASQTVQEEAVSQGPEYYSVGFPSPLVILHDFEVKEKDNPRELVEFALMLHQKSKFREAARFFLDAASLDAGNNDNGFRVACFSSAAVALLSAKDFDGFHKVIERITSELDMFQSADKPDNINVLISISKKLRGEKTDLNPDLSINIKDILR